MTESKIKSVSSSQHKAGSGRTTPVLLGLFSIITLLTHRLARVGELPVRQAAWYRKTLPTFSGSGANSSTEAERAVAPC